MILDLFLYAQGMINWKALQTKLGVAADGKPGPVTFGALLRYVFNKDIDPAVARGLAQSTDYFITPQRLADFIGQTGHESANYTRFTENLNYAGTAALKTWPSHFNKALADWANRNPERIAEVAYGVKSRQGKGRMGNTQPGEGWRYRGRGPLQLTGKDNYRLYGSLLSLDLLANPDLAADPTNGIKIAVQYYSRNGIWKAIDENDLLGARKIVNMGNRKATGQPLGYTHVNDIRNKVLSLFRA